MTSKSPINVLIVDDDTATRTLLHRWIERGVNAVVLEAEDGLQALELVGEKPIDLVISDIKMPVLDGIEMLRLLRTDPRNKTLEILMVSHVAAEDSVRDVIELGASDYLLKPLQYDKAIHRIKRAEARILDLRESEESAADKPRIIIADPADDFCEMAKRHLGPSFAVKTARSVAEMLVHILRWQPEAVLLSPKMPGLDLSVLFQRVKALRPDQWPKFIRLCEPGAPLNQDDAREKGYGAAITKSYVAQTLLDEVSESVLGVPKSADALSTWSDFFEEELTIGLYQTLGMMTGSEPEEAGEPDNSWSPEMFGRIGIRSEDERFVIQIGVDSSMALASELGLALLGEPVEGEECKDAFKEVLNVVAGRIRNACAERNLAVSMQLPEASGTAPESVGTTACRIEKQFIWKGSHRFRISLETAMLEGDPNQETKAQQEDETAPVEAAV